jgi:hypothetical protein
MTKNERRYVCVVCVTEKAAREFGRHPVSRRRNAHCRECSNTREALALWRQANYRIPKLDRSILGR